MVIRGVRVLVGPREVMERRYQWFFEVSRRDATHMLYAETKMPGNPDAVTSHHSC